MITANTIARYSRRPSFRNMRGTLGLSEPQQLMPATLLCADTENLVWTYGRVGRCIRQIARKAHALGCIGAEKYDEAVAEFREIMEEISRKMV